MGKKLPCGLSWKFPNFCKNKKCENCVLNNKNSKLEREGKEDKRKWKM